MLQVGLYNIEVIRGCVESSDPAGDSDCSAYYPVSIMGLIVQDWQGLLSYQPFQ